MTTVEAPGIQCIRWHEGRVDLLDQTRLPQDEVWLKLNDYRDVIDAIRQMRIRGAPAIGVAGAYALALAAAEFSQTPGHPLMSKLETAAVEIKAARPTGANLAWAVDRMLSAAGLIKSGESMAEALAAEAIRIQQEDADANRRIGRLGADLLDHGSRVLTHCNAGALATGGYGTALGVIRTAWADRRIVAVFATETRPLLQGARLTAWELVRSGIDTTLLPDSAAGQLIRGAGRHRRRRPDRRQRRRGQQDRNLQPGRDSQGEPGPLLRGGPDEHNRPNDAVWRLDPHRGAVSGRGHTYRRSAGRRRGR